MNQFNALLTEKKLNDLEGIEQIEKMCSDFCKKKWGPMIGKQEANNLITNLKEGFASTRKTPGLPIFSHVTVNGEKFTGRRSHLR